MRHLWRVRAVGALLGLLPISAPAAPSPDATALFRDETASAVARLRWKGQTLEDETRFAIAASGLSWQPVWNGQPLLRHEKRATVYADASDRRAAFFDAQRAGDSKIAFPFALSLVLAPPEEDARTWNAAFDYLCGYGPDFDKALIGILQAPERLPLLPTYQYAAMDVLVMRATMRLLPLFLTLAESSDRYLRSRAVAAIGILGYRALEGHRRTVAGLSMPLQERSVSAVLRANMEAVVHRAAEDKNYRVRAAAALALGLMGGDDSLALLERLAKDRAYLAHPAGEKGAKRVVFPVRAQAAVSLARFDRQLDPGGGVLSGKALQQATRGGKDVTRDYSDIRRDRASRVRFCAGDW